MDHLRKCEGCQFWLELRRFSSRGSTSLCNVCTARRRHECKKDDEIERLRGIILNYEQSSRLAGIEVATMVNNINRVQADNTHLLNTINALNNKIHYMQVEQRVWFNLMADQITGETNPI